MCVTKKKQKDVRSTRIIGQPPNPPGGGPPMMASSFTPAATATPATRSATAQSADKRHSKSKKMSKEKKSEAERKSEDHNENNMSELKKLAERAISMGKGPPVVPPVKRDAKRIPDGFKSPKDKQYITLEEAVPMFEKARLKGFNDDEKTLKVEATQPSAGDEQKNQNQNQKQKKASEEKSSAVASKE
ncbi:Protein CBG21194 [Caenorhabditis briggsae]|uniref:Protein CBG21194 n=2 Tax=Caenorhabditis briggsae TaxID=6238 RepID=A8XZM7_CAEBR|nr:Protein CBG21194 [Caenorhabditis briggsae]ULU03036.1 hypothetical protein L3Y34_002548 [Caenorhabditis briggsae]CAP38026.1 Protein CBG21194 [Caenorhabditis briggsae]